MKIKNILIFILVFSMIAYAPPAVYAAELQRGNCALTATYTTFTSVGLESSYFVREDGTLDLSDTQNKRLNDGFSASPRGEYTNTSVGFVGTGAVNVITFDLGTLATGIDSVCFLGAVSDGGSSRAFSAPKLEYGTNGTEYTEILEKTESTANVGNDENWNDVADYIYTFTAVSARYIRITVTNTAYITCFDEIEIYALEEEKQFSVVVSAPEIITPGSIFEVFIFIRDIPAANGIVSVDFELAFDNTLVEPIYTQVYDMEWFMYTSPGGWVDIGSRYVDEESKYCIRFAHENGNYTDGATEDDTVVFKIRFMLRDNVSLGAEIIFNALSCTATDAGNADGSGVDELYGNGVSSYSYAGISVLPSRFVATDWLNLRSIPSSTDETSVILAEIAPGTSFLITEYADEIWGKICYGDYEGWVCLDFAEFMWEATGVDICAWSSLTLDANERIDGLMEYATVTELKNQFESAIKVYGRHGEDIENAAFVGTGFTVRGELDGGEEICREIVIKGDIDSDGIVTASDYENVKLSIKGNIPELDGCFLDAADINNDGRISSTDLLVTKRHISGTLNLFDR